MIKCQKCGNEIPNNSKFCPFCASAILTQKEDVEPKETVEEIIKEDPEQQKIEAPKQEFKIQEPIKKDHPEQQKPEIKISEDNPPQYIPVSSNHQYYYKLKKDNKELHNTLIMGFTFTLFCLFGLCFIIFGILSLVDYSRISSAQLVYFGMFFITTGITSIISGVLYLWRKIISSK